MIELIRSDARVLEKLGVDPANLKETVCRLRSLWQT